MKNLMKKTISFLFTLFIVTTAWSQSTPPAISDTIKDGFLDVEIGGTNITGHYQD